MGVNTDQPAELANQLGSFQEIYVDLLLGSSTSALSVNARSRKEFGTDKGSIHVLGEYADEVHTVFSSQVASKLYPRKHSDIITCGNSHLLNETHIHYMMISNGYYFDLSFLKAVDQISSRKTFRTVIV